MVALVVEVRPDERWRLHGGGCLAVAAEMEISNLLDRFFGTCRRRMLVRCGYIRRGSATHILPTFSTHALIADALYCVDWAKQLVRVTGIK